MHDSFFKGLAIGFIAIRPEADQKLWAEEVLGLDTTTLPRRYFWERPKDNGTYVLPMKQSFIKDARLMPGTRIMLALLTGWAGRGEPLQTTEGTIAKHLRRSVRQVYAISRADLVVIPTQGSQLDAAEATKAIKLIRQQEKAFHKKIPYSILFTRTSSAIRPRTLQHIQAEFKKHGIKAFQIQIHEREAYRALFSFGGTIENLNPQHVSNLAAAVINARAFAGEVVAMLRGIETETTQAAEVA